MYYSNLTLKDLKGIKKLSKIIKPIFSVIKELDNKFSMSCYRRFAMWCLKNWESGRESLWEIQKPSQHKKDNRNI